MKIKKVDDKPMVIHTKQKAKLHIHAGDCRRYKIKLGNKIDNCECLYWAKGCEITFACLILKNWIVKLNIFLDNA